MSNPKLNICPICNSSNVREEFLRERDPYAPYGFEAIEGAIVRCNHCKTSLRVYISDSSAIEIARNGWNSRRSRRMTDSGYSTCPCCGSSDSYSYSHPSWHEYGIACNSCGLDVEKATPDEAKHAWNG